MNSRTAALLMLACTASLGHAEQRFYQVLGADGRMHTVVSDDDGEKLEKRKGGSDEGAVTLGAPVTEAAKAESKVATPEKAPSIKSGFAPYDGDSYMSSEALEASDFNVEKKEKFYFLNDAAGQQVMAYPVETDDAASLSLSAGNAGRVGHEDSVDLPLLYRELNAVEYERLINGTCLPASVLQRSIPVTVGQSIELLHDTKARIFLQEKEPVQVYKLAGSPPSMRIRSYAKVDKSPSFFSPYIAFADENGCVIRVAADYFQRKFPATRKRHMMLEADIDVRDGEKYIFVLESPGAVASAKELPYELSRYGSITMKW